MTGVSPSVNVADLVAETLVQVGVSRVFAYPGDPIIEFMERCRQRGIDITLACREGSAGFMAEGAAMTTGKLGVCLSTLGPGSTALVNPVAAATLDRVPMLAVSGQIETSRQATFTHQVVEHERLFSPVTKWAARVEVNAVTVTLRKALRIAHAERPGAVHLSVAADTFSASVTRSQSDVPPVAASGSIQVFSNQPKVDPHGRLSRSRRPLLLLGVAAMRAGAGQAALRLARQVGAPVVVSPMAKGTVPEDDEWFCGVLDMACNATVWELLAASDLIVAAGFDAVELIKPWGLRTPVMHVDALANTDQVYPSEIELIGDVAAILDWLVDGWSGQQRWALKEVAAFREKLKRAYYYGRVSGDLNPTDVVDIARRLAPRETIVTTDVGSHKLLVGQGWTAYEPRSVLMSNGLSSMGFGIPSAIGAKLAQPERPVMAIVGDGGFAMTATELRLAAARRLGVVCVVLVDESLNRIELKQAASGYPSTATRIKSMDLVKMAEAMDCDGVRTDSPAELETALRNLGQGTRPLVIEARINPAQYRSQF